MAQRKNAPLNQHFVDEIKGLLDAVPAEQWADPDLRGVCYDYVPWHRMSCVTIQRRDEDPEDMAAWKYYWSAESDNSCLEKEYEKYHESKDGGRVYHGQLIEAAAAMLSMDFSKYVGQPVDLIYGLGLNKTFFAQVYHLDGVFRFNYCEYVHARQLEIDD